ncbi:MAG: sigma-70 family RNA polymerase sigma factor [Nitrospirales bacterium]|nr:sigma-70 family RNA polymerase sigma factor [Nitrospirales bacterium]
MISSISLNGFFGRSENQVGHQAEHIPETHPLLDEVMQELIDHRQAFHGFLAKRLDNAAFAEDLLQQCFIKAMAHFHSIKQMDKVIPWFYQILRHTLIDYYRSQETDAKRLQTFLDETAILGTNQVPSLDELQPTVCACLDRLVVTLKPVYADLIRRIDLSGESIQTVAKDLQITTNNLTVRLHRARHALRQSLENACGICSKHGCLNCTCE